MRGKNSDQPNENNAKQMRAKQNEAKWLDGNEHYGQGFEGESAPFVINGGHLFVRSFLGGHFLQPDSDVPSFVTPEKKRKRIVLMMKFRLTGNGSFVFSIIAHSDKLFLTRFLTPFMCLSKGHNTVVWQPANDAI